jgi:hypothetical protein
MIGISDGLNVDSEREEEIESDSSVTNGSFLEVMHFFNLLLTWPTLLSIIINHQRFYYSFFGIT